MLLETKSGVKPSKIALFFGFEYSPQCPGKGGDSSGARVIEEVCRSLPSDIAPLVVSKSAEWLSDVTDVDGIYLEKGYLEEVLAFDETAFVEYELFLSILAEVEALALRRKEFLWSNKIQVRMKLESKIRFWFRFFDEFSVKYYVSSNVPHRLDDYIAYRLAKHRGIPRLCFYRLPIVQGVMSRLIMFRDIGEQVNPLPPGDFLAGEGSASGARYAHGTMKALPSDLKSIFDMCVQEGRDLKEIARSSRTGSSGDGSGVSNSHVSDPKSSPSTQNSQGIQLRALFHKLWRNLCQGVAGSLEKWGYKVHSEPPAHRNEPFFLLMLHYQPEASSRPLGGFWANQLRLIETLSQALPADTWLYVREHPRQASKPGYRGGCFYSKISRMKGVRLVGSSSADELFDYCLATITLTGTAAFEALVKGKPALVMGDTALANCQGVFAPINFRNLCEILSDITQGTLSGAGPEDVKRFFEWVEAHSFIGYLEPYVEPRIQQFFGEDENVQMLTDLITGWMYRVNEGDPRCS